MKTSILPLSSVVVVTMLGCNSDIETKVARGLMEACPITDPSSFEARDECANKLAAFIDLRDASADPISWGMQAPDTTIVDALDDSHVTDFNPLVWRKMYLSTYMFEKQPIVVEQAGDRRVVRLNVQFRHSMDAGEFPYPFWHSDAKWTSYQHAKQLYLYFQNGVFVGALRSLDQDPGRPATDRSFDGHWMWNNGAEPRVALYRYLFSSTNPHVTGLETAYRTLEEEMRFETCFLCHSPDNISKMKHLELLSYPNQALTGRHDIVRMFELNVMPPLIGISDPARREEMISLAKNFAELGDRALAFEREPLLK